MLRTESPAIGHLEEGIEPDGRDSQIEIDKVGLVRFQRGYDLRHEILAQNAEPGAADGAVAYLKQFGSGEVRGLSKGVGGGVKKRFLLAIGSVLA